MGVDALEAKGLTEQTEDGLNDLPPRVVVVADGKGQAF
jgi:hypothetical protein